MKAFRHFTLIAAILLPLLAPAMACVLPGAQLSAAERACCKQMKNQCGDTDMPASHGCCHKDLSVSGYLSAVPASSTPFHVLANAVISGQARVLDLHDALTDRGTVLRYQVTLPQSPPSAISILRI